jgi:ribose transport system ATP-binding protein
VASPLPAAEQDAEELRISGVAKGYLGVQALKGVDLLVRRGSIHALAGQNGAGKSTLVKILSGAEAPDSGKIVLGGRRTRKTQAYKPSIRS